MSVKREKAAQWVHKNKNKNKKHEPSVHIEKTAAVRHDNHIDPAAHNSRSGRIYARSTRVRLATEQVIE